MTRIAVLGAGAWGFSLATLLAAKGNNVILWTRDSELSKRLVHGVEHPHLAGHTMKEHMEVTTDLAMALKGAEIVVEAVTAAGLRPVLKLLKQCDISPIPLVITSKGIEQDSLMILPEVAVDVLGDAFKSNITLISGPSYAQEVIKRLPTSIVGTGYDYETMKRVCDIFNNHTFRVYPNSDIIGISYGGALKNIIAIACGIAEGLALGSSAKAALMTRGLHEIRKLAIAKGASADTLAGLSGMGDLCLTCGSMMSRNSRFGYLLAQGATPQEAEKKIDMVVEGAYTCISALQISKKLGIPMPISDMVYRIVYENLPPPEAVKGLMQRAIKDEHL